MSGKSKKAISPLIASALLVAITFSVAIFVSEWFSSVAKTQSNLAINCARPECTSVGLAVINANFTKKNNSVNDNYTLIINIENTGTTTTNIIKIQILYADETIDDAIFYVNKSGFATEIGNITLCANTIKSDTPAPSGSC